MLASFKKKNANQKSNKSKTFGRFSSSTDKKAGNNDKVEDVTAELSTTSFSNEEEDATSLSSSFSSSVSGSNSKTTGNSKHKTTNNADLPQEPVSEWPTRPIWMCPTATSSSPLPLGKVVDISNEFFVGKVFLRVRPNRDEDMNEQDTAYFANKKRIFQIVWQGRFTRPTHCSDIWMGGIFDKPFNMAGVVRWVVPLLKQVVPGLEMDVLGAMPTVLAPASAACKNIHVCLPGQEPDMQMLANNAAQLQEDTELLGSDLKSSPFRRKMTMMSAHKRSQYVYDPKYVYTFEYYDYIMDLHNFEVKVPLLGGFPMKTWFNSQPLSIFVGNKDDAQNQALFHFQVYHEELMDCSNEAEDKAIDEDWSSSDHHVEVSQARKKIERKACGIIAKR